MRIARLGLLAALGCTSPPATLDLPADPGVAAMVLVARGTEATPIVHAIDVAGGAGLPLRLARARFPSLEVHLYAEGLGALGLRPGLVTGAPCRPLPRASRVLRAEGAAWVATSSPAATSVPCADCGPGAHDGGDGRCAPAGTCRPGFHDGGLGSCVPAGTCAPDLHDDGTGACTRSGCAIGHRDQGDGTCGPADRCAPGFHDVGGGRCGPAGTCAFLYRDVGGDECALASTPCRPGYHEGGAWTCLPVGACVAGFRLAADGSCHVPGMCPPGALVPRLGPGPLPRSCAEAQAQAPRAASGVVTLDPDGPGGVDPLEAVCDQTTDGGGWTLVLRYVHRAGTDPIPARLPHLPLATGEPALGDDEAGTPAFGHALPGLASLVPADELRFECRTSSHERVVHFATTGRTCLSLAKTGEGECGEAGYGRPLDGHTGLLPWRLDGLTPYGGDDALLRSPFFASGVAYWSIGEDGRFACDDAPAGGEHDTIHRVWTRHTVPHLTETHDGGDGACVPAAACSAGFVRAETGVCLPEETCPLGRHDGGDGACVLEGRCSPGFGLDDRGVCFRWRAIAGAPARHGHRLLPIDERRVLIAGGKDQSSAAIADTVIVDLVAGTVSPGPRLDPPRTIPTLVVLPDGRSLLAGGFLDAAWSPAPGAVVFDPAALRFTPIPVAAPRFGAAGAVIPSAQALILGGDDGAGRGLATGWRFDPRRDRFEVFSDLPDVRIHARTAYLPTTGELLLFAGIVDRIDTGAPEDFALDVERWTWRPLSVSLTRRVFTQAAVAPSGELLLFGGIVGRDAIAESEAYDPRTGRTRALPSPAVARGFGHAVALGDGRIVLLAGTDAAGLRPEVELFDPETEGWSSYGELPLPAITPEVHRTPGGRIFVAGGITAFGPDHTQEPAVPLAVVLDGGVRRLRR